MQDAASGEIRNDLHTESYHQEKGGDIRKGTDTWKRSVAVIVLAGLVHFGDYAKEVMSFNLFSVWLLVDVSLILESWYVWGCKAYRRWC